MSSESKFKIDSRLDLVLERVVDLPPGKIWAAWTQPELVVKWFTPAPWQTIACEIDLRPGGAFRTVMRSPEGQEYPNEGCYLEVVENNRLVWTDVLLPGFRPVKEPVSGAGLHFTGVILLEPEGRGTRYTAISMHRDEEDCKKHDSMGFHKGWGIALDQLIEVMRAT